MAVWMMLYLLAAYASDLPVVPALAFGANAIAAIGFARARCRHSLYHAFGIFLIAQAPLPAIILTNDSLAPFIHAWMNALAHDKILAFASAWVIILETCRTVFADTHTGADARDDHASADNPRNRVGHGSDDAT